LRSRWHSTAAAQPKGAWFAAPNSIVDVLATEGGNVRRVGTAKAGQLAEGIAFSPDGGYLYVADFIDSALRVYKVEGTGVRDTQQGTSGCVSTVSGNCAWGGHPLDEQIERLAWRRRVRR
jgi:DNA-binding beta-propeller fold protein YncE